MDTSSGLAKMRPTLDEEQTAVTESRQAGSDSAHQLPLPKLTHIDPAIFVLAREGLTQPMSPQRDRVQRVKCMLENMDEYQRHVRANFHHLVCHEKQRIEQGCASYEHGQETTAHLGFAISPEEAKGIVAAMSAPADPDTDFNISATAEDLHMRDQFQGEDEPPSRGNSLRQLGRVVEQAVHHIEAFSLHMTQLRGRWESILEREEGAVEGLASADKMEKEHGSRSASSE